MQLNKAIDNASNAAEDADVKSARSQLAKANDALNELQLGSITKYFKDNHIPEARAAALASLTMGDLGKVKPYAVLDTWPWQEPRGPNPFLMATGQLGKPWEIGHFWEWFLTQQGRSSSSQSSSCYCRSSISSVRGADFLCRLYFLCVLIWTVATWAVFGGAITRIAAVQVRAAIKSAWWTPCASP